MKYRVPLREDGLFFNCGHSTMKAYTCHLDSLNSLQDALAGKHIWIVGASTYVRERLSFLFSQMASFAQSITETHLSFAPEDKEDLQSLVERLATAPDSHVLFLAENDYGMGLNTICELTPSLLPVLTPVGTFIPAAPSGGAHVGALCVKTDSVQRLLSGKTVALWGEKPECLDRIFREAIPADDSIIIAGVVHETIKKVAIGGKIFRTCSPAAINELRCDALIITQKILNDDTKALMAAPAYMPVVMLRDAEANIAAPPVGEALLFYSQPTSPGSSKVPTYAEIPLVLHNGYIVNGSKADDYENGFRKTADQPLEFDNRIYVLGPSHSVSYWMTVEETYCSLLQQLLNKNTCRDGKVYSIQNLGVRGSSVQNSFLCLCDTQINNGDIVLIHNYNFDNNEFDCIVAMHKLCINKSAEFIVFNHALPVELTTVHEEDHGFLDIHCFAWHKLSFDAKETAHPKKEFTERLVRIGIRAFNLAECLDNADRGIFYDVSHMSAYGNKLIAEYMYEKITTRQEHELSDVYAKSLWDSLEIIRNITLSREENKQWLNQIPRIRARAGEIIGSIVMNCNPFTLGHKHIIAESLNKVDKLYIFVVQEDLSYFSFEERYSMVCDGTREFGSRVCVVPSGKLIISSATFPEYFCKDIITYEPDTRTDILIFCSVVARDLGIQVRLFGEEPYCKVTAAYHKQLSELLPLCCLLPIQIPRLEQHGVAISASSVRRILADRKFSQLARLVPPTTMPYLIKKALPDMDGADIQKTG